MSENDILDIKNLKDEDLLELYSRVTEHIKFLHDSIITYNPEEGGDISDES